MYVRLTRLGSTLLAAAVGLVALGTASPAAAATTPTISAPAAGTGFGPITITGTAAAGAQVTLIEAAYLFRGDMRPAVNFDTGGTVTAIANSAGRYAMARILDSGFVFAVEADGLRSPTIAVGLRLAPELTLTTASGTVDVRVAANLAQPGLPVHIQRAGSGGAWTTVNSGATDGNGDYAAALTGRAVGTTERYRAYLETSVAHPTGYADRSNNLWSNWSATMSLVVGGSGAVTRTAAGGVPAAPGGAPVTSPTPPARPAPKAGGVRFSKIQYRASSLNGEYFRLTNTAKSAVNLAGWTVRDAGGHAYKFGSYRLGAGKTVYVHTGRGTNGVHRYWGRASQVWNNGGDTGTLRNSAGRTIDTCRYKGTSKGYSGC